MKDNPTVHKRRSIRLQGYDYSLPGAYFITVCTYRHICLFGDIVDGRMRLSAVGEIVADQWLQTAAIREEIELDEWVVMPNHFHGIVFIVQRGDSRRGDRPGALTAGPRPKSIGAMVAGFKSAVTRRVNAMRHTPGVKVWQRNYYEHIIRSEPEIKGLREYIRNNPKRWTLDRLYRAR